jgi:hypothetical protein
MPQTPPPEIEPVSLTHLALLTLGTFLVLFLLLEALDPRWIASFRGPPPTPATSLAPSPIALRPLPRPPLPDGAEAAGQPAGGGGVSSGSGAGPKLAVVAPLGEGAVLRAAPGGAGQELARLPAGTGLELTGQEQVVEGRRWVEVRSGEGLGWLEAALLAPAETRP